MASFSDMTEILKHQNFPEAVALNNLSKNEIIDQSNVKRLFKQYNMHLDEEFAQFLIINKDNAEVKDNLKAILSVCFNGIENFDLQSDALKDMYFNYLFSGKMKPSEVIDTFCRITMETNHDNPSPEFINKYNELAPKFTICFQGALKPFQQANGGKRNKSNRNRQSKKKRQCKSKRKKHRRNKRRTMRK